MKLLTKIFQALLGAGALIITAFVAAGRHSWHTIRNWWKKCSKILLILIMLICVGFIALLSFSCCHNIYRRWYWKDKNLSENIQVYHFRDNKYRVYNEAADKYTTKRLDWVSDTPPNDSLAVYAIANKRGYINAKNGEIVIDAERNNYRKAWIFSEGVAAVLKDNKIGFINADNETVIPFNFNYTNNSERLEIHHVFHNGCCVMSGNNGNFGLIDKSGNWIIYPDYKGIWSPRENGYRVLLKDDRYGVMDSTCNVTIPCEYSYIEIVDDGIVLAKEGRMWKVDFEGNTTQPLIFNNTNNLSYPNTYNEDGDITYTLSDFVKYEILNHYGIMNRVTGESITPAIYWDINMLSKDLFEVQDPKSGGWYLVDTKGNVVSKK